MSQPKPQYLRDSATENLTRFAGRQGAVTVGPVPSGVTLVAVLARLAARCGAAYGRPRFSSLRSF